MTRIRTRGDGRFRPSTALRLALKGLRRSPGTAILAVTILALGMAAPTVFFSLLVGAVRPLPVPDGDRVVRVDVVAPSRGGAPLSVALGEVAALRGATGLAGPEAFRVAEATLVDPGRAATRLSLAKLTREAFDLLRVAPLLGRLPEPAEAGAALLLREDVWDAVYDRDPGVLGHRVQVDAVTRVVVGVMPSGFGFPLNQNAWTLLDAAADSEVPVEFFGRLADGASADAVAAELGSRWRSGDRAREADRTGGVVRVDRFTGSRGERGEALAFLGLVAVALCLLLIACANVANLLLVRASERIRALGIQVAIGAGRLQIGAQLLLESVLLAGVGGLVGLAGATVAVDALQSALAAEHWGYFWMRMEVDATVVAFTGLLVLGTALVAGMLPIVRVSRMDVQLVLKAEDPGGVVGGESPWSRAFVSTQIALSCAALVAAALTGRAALAAADLGGDLEGERVILASVGLDSGGRTGRSVVEELDGRLRALPGVTAAAVGSGAPGYFEPYGPLEVEGTVYERPEDRARTFTVRVTPGYLELFGQRLLEGRWLTVGDAAARPAVAVVSRSFVERFAPGGSIVGTRVRVGADERAPWRTVVGVVSDVALGGGARARTDRVYVPFEDSLPASALLMARVTAEPASLAPRMREVVAAVDPSIPVAQVRTLAEGHAYLTRVPRAMSALAVGGGGAGFLVAAVGLYGLLVFRVRQRRRELGVRLALGAHGRVLARETVGAALRRIGPAVAVGLTLAWIAAPALGPVTLGADVHAPGAYVGVGLAFLAVGLIASAVPALRAASTDPARVLRGE